jgi:hypothetical protein
MSTLEMKQLAKLHGGLRDRQGREQGQRRKSPGRNRRPGPGNRNRKELGAQARKKPAGRRPAGRPNLAVLRVGE